MSSIIPAILPKTREALAQALSHLDIEGVETVQLDVVDGRFAVPASWPYSEGADALASLARGNETLPNLGRFSYDLDLMVEDPEPTIGDWLTLGARRLTLHLESMPDALHTLARIKARYGHETGYTGAFELGLALNIDTDLALLEPCLPLVDYVQLMGIATIGRQSEPFDVRVMAKLKALRAAHPALTLQVDGGVSLETAAELLAAGASRLVVGHALVGAADPARAFTELAALAEPAHTKGRAAPLARASGSLTDADVAALAAKAEEIRETIIEMLVAAGSGHTAGPLGMADIFTAFYFHILTHDPKNPEWEERDRLVLSNGHIVPVRYAAMAHAGYFSIAECLTLRKFGSRLQGHPERLRLPGLETTSGPLGEGLAQAAGMAYALRMDASKSRVYCLMSDGEQQEGNTWEAAMFVGKYKLANLTAVMDRNNIQIDGMTEEVMPLEPIADKYRAFGWHVLEVGGHDIRAFVAAVEEAKAIVEKPTLILAHTIPGKGVPDIEYDYHWHGKPPTKEEGKRFLHELRTLGGRVPHDYA